MIPGSLGFGVGGRSAELGVDGNGGRRGALETPWVLSDGDASPHRLDSISQPETCRQTT